LLKFSVFWVWVIFGGRLVHAKYQPHRCCGATKPHNRAPTDRTKYRLWAYYNCDTSTIRVRFEHDSATTRYEVFRALAYEIDSSTPRESVVGVSCMLIDSSMHTIFTLYRVCVNMPEIVYTNATKCQYAEYTIIHCEIIVMLK